MPEQLPRKQNVALQYAGWGTQMLVLLALAVYAGIQIDKKIHIKALFVVILPLIALALSLYQLIRTLSRKNNR